MAVASTVTKLPLDTFARVLGIHPLHFNQVEVETLAPQTVCGQPFVQYAWQAADRIGREEIAQAIADAEFAIEEQLHFSVMPSWQANERMLWPRISRPDYSGPAWSAPVRSKLGYIRSGGVLAKTLIAAGAAVVYSDTNTDGYFETATITVPTTVTDPEEIAVYYPGEAGSDEWWIRPATVSIAGGNATIVLQRHQLLDPDRLEEFNPRAVDGLVNANFLSTVDVYRRYNDPSTQITFAWRGPTCDCGLVTCSQCTSTVQSGCMQVEDSFNGIIRPSPATWVPATATFTSDLWAIGWQPDWAFLNYYAGYGTSKVTMDRNLARAVVWLAVSMLDRPLCACDHIQAIAQHWREDLSLSYSGGEASNSYNIDPGTLNNPLGTTRGAISAWRIVQNLRRGESACVL